MPKYLVCNWKANKTEKETIEWFREVTVFDFSKLKDIEIIACLPFVFLAVAKSEIERNKLPIKLGAQNVSHFKEGPYTGVVTAGMLQGLVDYVMIGHSERRKLLGETDEMVKEKLTICLSHNLSPIICVSNLDQVNFLKKEFKNEKARENSIFLYEPIEAIGSGKAENPKETCDIIMTIKKIIGEIPVLYGGSVTPDNVSAYLTNSQIDGVAVGGASLDSASFLTILKNVAKI